MQVCFTHEKKTPIRGVLDQGLREREDQKKSGMKRQSTEEN
jgi:hypothetical protein